MSCTLHCDALYRGGARVLGPAVLEVPRHAAVGVIGANGAGKSTLFLALMGLLRSGGGAARVRVAGQLARPCFMPQEPALPEWLTAREAIALYAGCDVDSGLAAALQLEPLLSRRVGSLSGGEVQAVALAAGLGHAGDVLLLDEPIAHLDFRRRLAAIRVLRDCVAQRELMLISSQNAADLASFCTWYLVLVDGHIVFNGSIADLLDGQSPAAADRIAALESRLVALLEGRRSGS